MAGRDERRTRQVPVEARHAYAGGDEHRYGQVRENSLIYSVSDLVGAAAKGTVHQTALPCSVIRVPHF